MPRLPPLPAPLAKLSWLFQLAYTTLRLFKQNGLQNHAAATSFYFLLSATPVLLLLSVALQWIEHLAQDYIPATILMAALYDQLKLDSLTALNFIPQQAKLATGGVGLITLLLSSRGLVHAVQNAFRVIFPDPAKRNFLLSWVLPLVILPVLFALMGTAAVVQVLLGFLEQTELIGVASAQVFSALNSLFGLAMIWALLFAAYWRLPRQHPRRRDAALFALGATVSLALLLALFSSFFHIENYHNLYGTLGGVVFVLIGGYFAFLLLYLWAQALYAYGKADITALDRLFAEAQGDGMDTLEGYLFADTHTLMQKYGHVHPPGHVLIHEGDTSRTAYFLSSGKAGVYKGSGAERRRVGDVKEGQLFGEMAYLLKEPRTASVIADTEITVLALPPHLLEQLMRSSARLSRHIIGQLCQRLERMNETKSDRDTTR